MPRFWSTAVIYCSTACRARPGRGYLRMRTVGHSQFDRQAVADDGIRGRPHKLRSIACVLLSAASQSLGNPSRVAAPVRRSGNKCFCKKFLAALRAQPCRDQYPQGSSILALAHEDQAPLHISVHISAALSRVQRQHRGSVGGRCGVGPRSIRVAASSRHTLARLVPHRSRSSPHGSLLHFSSTFLYCSTEYAQSPLRLPDVQTRSQTSRTMTISATY